MMNLHAIRIEVCFFTNYHTYSTNISFVVIQLYLYNCTHVQTQHNTPYILYIVKRNNDAGTLRRQELLGENKYMANTPGTYCICLDIFTCLMYHIHHSYSSSYTTNSM